MLSKKLDFKMYLLKQTVNRIAPRILRLSRGVQAKTPQSNLILHTWARLEDVLSKDAETGCFNDKNFRNLLESAKQALIFLCENDKYYKRWLGLLAFILAEELEKAYTEFDYAEALDMTVRPLKLRESEFTNHKRALWELHMTGYLYGMSRLPGPAVQEIREARAARTHIDFPGADPAAVVRMIFPDQDHTSFFMLLRDREVDRVEEARKE